MGCFSEILTAGLDRRAGASDKGSSERGPQGRGRAIRAVPWAPFPSLFGRLGLALTVMTNDGVCQHNREITNDHILWQRGPD